MHRATRDDTTRGALDATYSRNFFAFQAANESAILDMEDEDDEAKDRDAARGRKVK